MVLAPRISEDVVAMVHLELDLSSFNIFSVMVNMGMDPNV